MENTIDLAFKLHEMLLNSEEFLTLKKYCLMLSDYKVIPAYWGKWLYKHKHTKENKVTHDY